MPDFDSMFGVGASANATDRFGTTFSAPTSDTASKLDAILAQPQKQKSSGGWFDTLKHAAGDFGSSALKVLDTGRAAVVSTGKQLGNIGDAIIGKNQDNPDYRPSLDTWLGDTEKGIGAGDVIQQDHPNWSPWVKDLAGGALDIAADPLNAVAPGTDAVAKDALRKTGQVIGDEAARAALREGGTSALRTAVEDELATNAAKHGGAATLEDVLGRGTTEGLGKKGTEQVVQDRLAALDSARGGLTFGGKIPIPGTAAAGDLLHGATGALKGSQGFQAASTLIKPGTAVEQAFGKGAADVTSQAVHGAANAAREGRAALAPVADTLSKDEFTALLNKNVGQSIADNLVKDAPEIAKTATTKYEATQLAASDWVNLPGTKTYIHPLVDQALKDAKSAPASGALAQFDKINSAIKQLTVFNPLNAIQHDAKRGTFNLLEASTAGKAGLRDQLAGREITKAIRSVVKDGADVTAETLAAKGLSEEAAKQGEAFYKHIALENASFEFDKNAEGAAKGVWGTKKASSIAEHSGENNRAAVFVHALNDGLSPEAAAAKVRSTMLDFSSAGMTPFERDKLQRLAFFYKFPRQAIPAGVKFAAENPGEANLLSHLGVGVQQGARNQYGEHIGLAPDAPLESAFGGIQGLLSSPGNYLMGQANPLITAALDSKKRGAGDIIAPLGMDQSRLSGVADAWGSSPGDLVNMGAALNGFKQPDGGGLPVPGFSSGEDYTFTKAQTKDDKAQVKFAADIAAKAKSGAKLTAKERLTELAVKAGVDQPYAQNEKSLLQSLGAKGVSHADMLTALTGK